MKKENKTLSEKEYHIFNEDGFKTKDVKEHTQNAQRRLKDRIEAEMKIAKRVKAKLAVLIYETIVEKIDKIFLEEFGEKLI